MCLSDVRIVDEAGHEVPAGSVGELVVRSDQVSLGYWQNAGATAEAMRGGWFHTGDLGRRAVNGLITLVDRKKDMIISGGENVYSREVEDAIATLPGVAEVAVIGLPDEVWGERVVAVLVAEDGAALDTDRVIAHCRERLARYKVPKQVRFVPALPRNGTGKVRKPLLREEIAAQRATD
jgi:acyl-CoA synthetase (AMP-forming)/AMP-acid ligase II